MSLRVVPAVLFAVLVAAGASVSSQAPSVPLTFTDVQATRGDEVFRTVCMECHARKEMSNADFRVKWNGRAAFDLFELIRSTMPESSPGGLPRAQYLDVTAYFAKLNGMSAGTVELVDDEAMLKKQMLVWPPQTPYPGYR